MRVKIIILILIICSFSLGAVMQHHPEVQANYLKYKQLSAQNPTNKEYLFEFAMNLAIMGRIEQSGAVLKQINELDDNYAKTAMNQLESVRRAGKATWWTKFKLGFVYYFLYEEAIGRIDLANRRIKRARDNKPEDMDSIIATEKAVIAEREPVAQYYKDASLANFYDVARKTPKDYRNAWGYAYMAAVHGVAKEWQDAKALCEMALEIEGDAYAIRAAYMEALRQNGNLLAATGQLSKALALRSEQENYEKELFNE